MKEEIIKKLLTEGGKSIKDLKVKSLTVKECDKYVRLGITLDKSVQAYNNKDDGSYELGESNLIFISMFSILPVMAENELIGCIIPTIRENINSMPVLLSNAKIDIIQQIVPAGTVYNNPWSNKEREEVFDHDVIINHVVNIEFSEFALKKADKLADSLLGI